MENSQPLATESFSYSWLTNRKPQHSFDDNRSPSDQLFNFDFPLASPQTATVHADEIFSDGHIMPVYIHTSKMKNFKSAPSRQFVPRKTHFFGILKTLIGCSWKSNRVDNFDRAEYEASPTGGNNIFYHGDKKAKSWSNSPQRSPSSYCGKNSGSCDVESSIREAILYCKKSIEA